MNRREAIRDTEPQQIPGDIWREQNTAAVAAGLAWLRALLRNHIAGLRAERPQGPRPDGSQPILTDMDADWLLRRGDHCGYPHGEDVTSSRQAYVAARDAMLADGSPAAIDRISRIFGLSPFEEDVLLMTVASHMDAAISALFGYAHDRLTLDRPTAHLACSLTCGGDPAMATLAWRSLGPGATLRRRGLVFCAAEHPTVLTPLGTDEALARYICGQVGGDIRVEHLLRPVANAPATDAIKASAERLAGGIVSSGSNVAFICGPPRSGRRALAHRTAEALGLELWMIRIQDLPTAGRERRSVLQLVARETQLHDLAVLVDLSGLTAQDQSAEQTTRAIVEEIAAEPPALVLFAATRPHDIPGHVPHVHTAPLDEAERMDLWRVAWTGVGDASGSSPERLATHFQLGPTEITEICERTAAGLGTPDLWRACRETASIGLSAMADGIEPKFDWSDLVIPEDVLADLRAISAQVRHRSAVYGKGGFARKLVRGRGVSALFAGPSGVGKTMAAEVIARDLELDLYRIDLSRVISKYIGETEQNLRRVFDAAEAGGAVLFFDEADALFGKRSEVKDSHDRYANIEISYLLQRMETYSGLAILATNLKSHIDAAFLRRLRFVIDLPFPDASLREKIWSGAFPAETRTEGLDFKALGRLEVAGGNIVVIAVNAAFLAAAEGTPVRMDHIARAARTEMRKLDKQLKGGWPLGGAR